MDLEQIKEKLTPFILKHKLPLVLGLFGLMLFAYGLIGLFASKESSNSVIFESTEEQNQDPKTDKKIVIDVEGAVLSPGVYKLGSDARMQDAFIAAGGLSDKADREWVAKNINLAQTLRDGGKIYVPDKAQSANLKSQSYQGEDSTQPGLVNINLGSESELDTLPGIGPVTAKKIIENRPYNLAEELLNKKVVSSTVFEKIKEQITY